MSISFKTSKEVCFHLAVQAKARRLHINLSQKSLSEKSGVSLSVIKKFERLGKISLESLLKIALALGCLSDFEKLFAATNLTQVNSIDDLLKEQDRKRGRK